MFVFILGEDCSTGFYGFQPDCKTCPYPSYGLKCQSLCVCPKKSCNHVKGCFALIPDTGIFAIICTYYAVWSFLRGGEFQNFKYRSTDITSFHMKPLISNRNR